MWAPYEPADVGEPLDTLEQVPAFVLLETHVREGITTQFGPRDAVDLIVQTGIAGETRLFSGFAAGIVGQAKRLEPGDLPAVCKVVARPTRKGTTRGLELVEKVSPMADVAAIAKSLPTPVMPIGSQTNEIPY